VGPCARPPPTANERVFYLVGRRFAPGRPPSPGFVEGWDPMSLSRGEDPARRGKNPVRGKVSRPRIEARVLAPSDPRPLPLAARP